MPCHVGKQTNDRPMQSAAPAHAWLHAYEASCPGRGRAPCGTHFSSGSAAHQWASVRHDLLHFAPPGSASSQARLHIPQYAPPRLSTFHLRLVTRSPPCQIAPPRLLARRRCMHDVASSYGIHAPAQPRQATPSHPPAPSPTAHPSAPTAVGCNGLPAPTG